MLLKSNSLLSLRYVSSSPSDCTTLYCNFTFGYVLEPAFRTPLAAAGYEVLAAPGGIANMPTEAPKYDEAYDKSS